ncbi:hypothetical protein FA95DRAFT_1574063 [Auriscalpium vulgare]|uniref:Uncharacterized protein n=1 Tax=Auriscalpium vulgare TaxID=40419 RepID=A0ACB8RM99_9AGAM|nr:hypothetical protein FA95DRAFT_1574063 [Auriscalpium vulgare]
MSAPPFNQYTAAHALRWEQYAGDVVTWAGSGGQAPFPGDPPAGYIERFKVLNKFAPLVTDYPQLLHGPAYHDAYAPHPWYDAPLPQARAAPNPLASGVAMSENAFGQLLAFTAGADRRAGGWASRGGGRGGRGGGRGGRGNHWHNRRDDRYEGRGYNRDRRGRRGREHAGGGQNEQPVAGSSTEDVVVEVEEFFDAAAHATWERADDAADPDDAINYESDWNVEDVSGADGGFSA